MDISTAEGTKGSKEGVSVTVSSPGAGWAAHTAAEDGTRSPSFQSSSVTGRKQSICLPSPCMPGDVGLCDGDHVHAAQTDLPPGILVDRGIRMYRIPYLMIRFGS
jgi:hypothetical protein